MLRLAPAFALFLSLAACATDDLPPDVTGPYTGDVTRYLVDRIEVPASSTRARELADDLDGDGIVDNQFGSATGSLGSFANLTTHASDMIGAGVLHSLVEIQADDLTNDGSVSVWYVGRDGDPVTAAGGTLVNGAFRSNRSAVTRAPGRATVRLPVFVDTDPVTLDLEAVEIDLQADGHGGFNGTIRGGLDPIEAREHAYDGIRTMLAANPDDHRTFWWLLDKDYDGNISIPELDALVGPLLQPDVTIRGEELLSAAFSFHLVPCPGGVCPAPAVTDTCHDRVRDAAETDVDCGDGCLPCAGALRCSAPADCQSDACTAGSCAAPGCSDGVRDYFESDVDCGGPCAPCGAGKACEMARDCASQQCVGTEPHCF